MAGGARHGRQHSSALVKKGLAEKNPTGRGQYRLAAAGVAAGVAARAEEEQQ